MHSPTVLPSPPPHRPAALRDLARGGIAVASSIHAPSPDTFALFDRVLILQRGRAVYFGDNGGWGLRRPAVALSCPAVPCCMLPCRAMPPTATRHAMPCCLKRHHCLAMLRHAMRPPFLPPVIQARRAGATFKTRSPTCAPCGPGRAWLTTYAAMLAALLAARACPLRLLARLQQDCRP